MILRRAHCCVRMRSKPNRFAVLRYILKLSFAYTRTKQNSIYYDIWVVTAITHAVGVSKNRPKKGSAPTAKSPVKTAYKWSQSRKKKRKFWAFLGSVIPLPLPFQTAHNFWATYAT